MTETKKEPTYQPISFDAIKIGLDISGKDSGMVKR